LVCAIAVVAANAPASPMVNTAVFLIIMVPPSVP
jgi:hypothetical protein